DAVYKSIDGGASWNPAATGLPLFGGIAVLAIDPSAPATIFAAASGTGLYETINAGANWSLVQSVPTTDQFTGISISPVAGSPSIVTVTTNGDGAYISGDGGATFDAIDAATSRPANAHAGTQACEASYSAAQTTLEHAQAIMRAA